jgi:hypothetical protein
MGDEGLNTNSKKKDLELKDAQSSKWEFKNILKRKDIYSSQRHII